MPRWWHPHFYRVSPRIWKFPRQANSRQAADGVWKPMKAVWTPHLIPGYIPLPSPTPTQIHARNLSLIYPQCIRVLLPFHVVMDTRLLILRRMCPANSPFHDPFHRPHLLKNSIGLIGQPIAPCQFSLHLFRPRRTSQRISLPLKKSPLDIQAWL
jgi:hypothetical protein